MTTTPGISGRPLRLSVLAVIGLCLVALPGRAPANPTQGSGPETPVPGHEAAVGWELAREAKATRVFARSSPASRMREVLVRSRIAAPPERVLEVITDYARYAEFMPYVEESRVIRELEGASWVFNQLDFPWPIGDRYYTIEIATRRTDSEHPRIRVAWTLADPDPILPVGRGVLINVNDGYWELQATPDGKHTDVTYYVHTDPAGALPAWAINFANARAAPEVIDAVRVRATSD
jgi:ribosome-associated toxin RatA of RatAB toxin-antitoxin module